MGEAVVVADVALGANLPGPAGTPLETLRAAIGALDGLARTRLTARSRVYRSDPVDATGPEYLNQVVRLETALGALELLARLQGIEARFGRRRGARNAPRTLDLDLLTFGGLVTADSHLTVPHPRLGERLFVLMPLSDIEPALRLPSGDSIADVVASLQAATTQRCRPLA